ncbi:MAG: hypothetical protein HQL54_01535 [Magnetococcales bacterium]|nr:hypothetical protein [Magnetococcales bacterium]
MFILGHLGHSCGFDNENFPFDKNKKLPINSDWEIFLDRVWNHTVIPCINDIFQHHKQYLKLRQHEADLKENFILLYLYIYKVIKDRMAPPAPQQDGENSAEISSTCGTFTEEETIVVDLHKLSAAGLFTTLYLGPFALSLITKEEIDTHKSDMVAKPFLRDSKQTNHQERISIGAKFANELLAFRVGSGIALTELRHRARIRGEKKINFEKMTKEELEQLATNRSADKMILDLPSLEMPEDYEKHVLRVLSQSYFTGCFDILLWPHVFYWLQIFTIAPKYERDMLTGILHNLSSSIPRTKDCMI